MIVFQNADVYRRRILMLSNINITVEQGEWVYLTGRTGSGKSTFLKTLYGAMDVKGDKAMVNNMDLIKASSRRIRKLRHNMGMVFQDFQLLRKMTVHKNLMLVLRALKYPKQKRNERIREVLSYVEMAGTEDHLVMKLSGGEQQRIAVARAILNDPPLILADEPTGSLDPLTAKEILFLFKRLNKEFNTTILIATHQYNWLDSFPGRIISCQEKTLKPVEGEFTR